MGAGRECVGTCASVASHRRLQRDGVAILRPGIHGRDGGGRLERGLGRRCPRRDPPTRVGGSMSSEEKVGQLIQADIGSIKPEDLLRYKLGSILAGGNAAPAGDVRTS